MMKNVSSAALRKPVLDYKVLVDSRENVLYALYYLCLAHRVFSKDLLIFKHTVNCVNKVLGGKYFHLSHFMLPKCLMEDNYLKMLIHKGNNQNVSQYRLPNKSR